MMPRSKNAVKQLIEDISPGHISNAFICIISSAELKSESPTQVLDSVRTCHRGNPSENPSKQLSYSAKHEQIFTHLFGKINIDRPGTGVWSVAAWSTVSERGTR